MITLSPVPVEALAASFGGTLTSGLSGTIRALAPPLEALSGVLAPLFSSRHVRVANLAAERGASLLVASELAPRLSELARRRAWIHPYAPWAMARTLAAYARVPDGVSAEMAPRVTLFPRVSVGQRVHVGAGSVIGSPGFGFADGPQGERVHIPQLGGVIVEDDVWIGALVTIDAGTLSPTVIRRGVKIDAHVHVGHNCEIGEGTRIAAQTGLAGSVVIGRDVLIGGQVGIADHVTVGDGARVAAKSGVIGDVPSGATYGGYPAIQRARWLRGLARLYSERARRLPPGDRGG